MTDQWRRLTRNCIGLVGASLFGIMLSLIAFAHVKAITPGPSGVQVSPALQSLTLQTGQSAANYRASVTNNTNQAVTISLSAKDFTSLGVDGQLSFISPQAANASQHQLATSLSFSQNQFILAAHATQAITVMVNGAQKLNNGGHYAAILFSSASVGGANNRSQHVHFQQTVATLLFATTAGQGSYKLGVHIALPSIAWVHFPSDANLLFSNMGNVQITPRGYLSTNGPFGSQIKTIINPNSALVLPSTKRLLQTAVGASHRPFWPGIYTIHTYYRADNVIGFQTQTTRFVYLNLANVLAIIFVFSLAAYMLRTLISVVRKQRSKTP